MSRDRLRGDVRTSRLAIASLALSVLWLYALGSLLGLVLGIVAEGRIDRSGGTLKGRGLAIAGIVLGALGLVVSIILLAIAIKALEGGITGP
jgi:hypothetical protein